MYRLPDGRTITRPKQIEINGIIYPKNIFTQWSVEKLNSIDIYPINEQKYDKRRYNVISKNENIIDGILHITYELEEKEIISKNTPFQSKSNDKKELPTMNFQILDAGIYESTEIAWVKVRIGGKIGYLRVYDTK